MFETKKILRASVGLAALGLTASAQPMSQSMSRLFVPDHVDDVIISTPCTEDFADYEADGARLAEVVRRAHGIVGIGIASRYETGEEVGFTSPGFAHYTTEELPKGNFVRADVSVLALCNSFDFGNARGRLSREDQRLLDEAQSLMPEEEGTPI